MLTTIRHSNADWHKDLKKRLASSRGRVAIGFPVGTNQSSINKAYANEFGSEESSDLGQPIPARPFMKHSVPRIKHEAVNIASHGKLEDVTDTLERIGAAGVEAIVDTINMGGFQENSDYTLERKQGTQPLVDSGDMRGDVTFKVEGAE